MGKNKLGEMPWGRWVQGQPRKKFLKPSRRRPYGHFDVLKITQKLRSPRAIKLAAEKRHRAIEAEKKEFQQPLNRQQEAGFTKRHEEVAEAALVLMDPEERERYEKMYFSKFLWAESTHRVRKHRDQESRLQKSYTRSANAAHMRLSACNGELPPQYAREYEAKTRSADFTPWNGEANQHALMMIKGKPQLKFIRVLVVKKKYTSSANKKTSGTFWYVVRFDPKIVRDKRYTGQLCVTKQWLI